MPAIMLPTEQPSIQTEAPKPTRKLFDLDGAVDYLRELGLTGATKWFIRMEIAAKRLPIVPAGKKYYVTRAALDAWLAKSERRRRAS